MKARRSKPSDLDEVLRIEGKYSTTAHWSRRQISEELSAEASVFLVAESDAGDLAGFLIARRYPPNLEVLDIAVAAQRQGVGRFLMESLIAQAQGCDTITLEVSEQNRAGLEFYRALGFTVVGKRPSFYPDGSAAILLDLKLSA